MTILQTETGDNLTQENNDYILVNTVAITILPFTNISDTPSYFNAEVHQLITPSFEGKFQYREVGSTSWLETDVVEYDSTGVVSVLAEGLGVNKDFEYRFVAVTGLSEQVTSNEGFTTLGFNVVSEPLTIQSVDGSGGLLRVNYLNGNGDSTVVGFRYREVGESSWVETVLSSVVVGENTRVVSGLAVGSFETQVFFDDGFGQRLFGRVLTLPTLNLQRMFDSGVKRFDVGYDESQKELLYEEVF